MLAAPSFQVPAAQERSAQTSVIHGNNGPRPRPVFFQPLPLEPNLPRSTAAPMATKAEDRMAGAGNKKYFAFLHKGLCMSQLLVMIY